jgi:Predicted nucleotide kinase (related to CMP and AMP kinases)
MRVAVTGTPGVGKTTAVDQLTTELSVIHLNELVREAGLTAGHDENRDSVVVDDDAVADQLADQTDLLFESHLAHRYPADRIVVLRCHPATVEDRLLSRGMSPDSAAENAESEALDLVLAAAVDRHGRDAVYEVDTTDRSPATVAEALDAVINGTREPTAGTVSFAEYLSP